MTISIYEVCDPDCVVSLRPLILDLPCPNKYARGVDAILRRVLYTWCRDLSLTLPALEGTRWTRNGLLRYRVELEGAARRVSFVAGASVPLTLSADGARLTIAGRIDLVTGVSLPLEVSAGDAPAAILAFGASQL